MLLVPPQTASFAQERDSRATIARDEEDVFASVPLVGEGLAARIHDELDIDSLEGLEAAAHDGRLETVRGIGPERARIVREYLEVVLGSNTAPDKEPTRQESDDVPSVELILSIDDEYRRLAESGRLRCVTPRRFNPQRRAWLPVWHAMRDGWWFKVMYSNTGKAHDRGKTRDWVVVVHSHDDVEGEATVVTEYRGALKTARVVRGREQECRDLYDDELVTEDVRSWAHRIAESLGE